MPLGARLGALGRAGKGRTVHTPTPKRERNAGLGADKVAQGSIGCGGEGVGTFASSVNSCLAGAMLQEEFGNFQVLKTAGKHERRQAVVSAGSIYSSATPKQLAHCLKAAILASPHERRPAIVRLGSIHIGATPEQLTHCLQVAI